MTAHSFLGACLAVKGSPKKARWVLARSWSSMSLPRGPGRDEPQASGPDPCAPCGECDTLGSGRLDQPAIGAPVSRACLSPHSGVYPWFTWSSEKISRKKSVLSGTSQ